MDLRKLIYKYTFPLHHWVVRRDMFEYHDEIKELETRDSDGVRQYQKKRLKEMVRYCRNDIPYYQESLKDVDLEGKSMEEILQQIPILDKEHVRKDPEQFTNDEYADHKITTSGSTGTPLVMWASKEQLEKRLAMNQRNREWIGYEFGDRNVRLWHQKIGMSKIQVIKESIEAFLARRKFIPVFKMDDDNLGDIIEEIDQFDPELIDGYAEAYRILVEHCKENRIEKDWKRAVSSAQVLHPSTRKGIQEYLGAEVFDRYGAREFSGIAQECPEHDGKHINSYLYIVEVLDDNGNEPSEDEHGDIVITDLHNKATPLIRYKIGDLALPTTEEECGCGIDWPKIGKIVGREQSVIVTKEGKHVPGTFFDHFFKDYYDTIKQWQVVQETKNHLKVNLIVTSEKEFSQIENSLRDGLLEHLGGIEISFELKDDMEMVRTGKFRHTVSKVEE